MAGGAPDKESRRKRETNRRVRRKTGDRGDRATPHMERKERTEVGAVGVNQRRTMGRPEEDKDQGKHPKERAIKPRRG